MAQTLTQRMMELGVPFVMANELVKQIGSGTFNVTRLINAGWVEDLARYLSVSIPAGTFKATKAVEYSMVPAVATLVAVGGVPLPVISSLSSRLKTPGSNDNTSIGFDGVNTWHYCFVDLDLVSSANQLQFQYANFADLAAGVEDTLGPCTISAVMEYPIGGTQYPILFSGSSSKAFASREVSVWTDAITLPASASGKVRVYTLITHAASSGYIPNYRALGSEVGYRGSGATPVLGSAPAGAIAVTRLLGPMGFRGLAASNKPTVFILGDSNTSDQAYNPDAFGNVTYARIFSGVTPLLFNGYTSKPLSGPANGDFSRRASIMLDRGVQRAFIFLGINDVNDSTTLATMQPRFSSMAAKCRAVGVVPHFATIGPRTSGLTTGVATLSAVNDWLRSVSNTGDYGEVFDLSDILSTARNSNVWKTNYTTGDGLHINWPLVSTRDAVLAQFKTFANSLGLTTN